MHLRESHEAMHHAVCVRGGSRDHAREVNAKSYSTLAWASPRAGRIKEENPPAGSTHEAVIHTIRVGEQSRRGARQFRCGELRALRGPVPAPGTSNVVNVPSAERRKA